MRNPRILFRLWPLIALVITACATHARLPASAGFGPQPELPPPEQSALPTVNIAPAVGWSPGEQPLAAAGFSVAAFACGLDHPRSLHVLPNADVLVAETDAPVRPGDRRGIRGLLMGAIMRRAGSGHPSANRISLLRDGNHDGTAETRSVFIDGLDSPFGMALVGDALFVADTDALLRFGYQAGDIRIVQPGKKILDLPAGPINHHWTKNVVASADGRHLFVSIGSNSNVAENGIANEADRARVIEVELPSGHARPFATGLRNPVGMDWQPQSGKLWVAVNERDELGGDLVPDYMTALADGAFYGWPYSYYGAHVDARVQPQRVDLVAHATVPDYALGAHTASLGLAFYTGTLFPAHYRGGVFVAQHGSWNRRPASGYKVIFVPFSNGHPDGMPEDILSGFLDAHGHARGRPVSVALDAAGALLVADDVGGCVWRVTPR